MTTFHIDQRHIAQPGTLRELRKANRRAIIAHIILLLTIAIAGLTQ